MKSRLFPMLVMAMAMPVKSDWASAAIRCETEFTRIPPKEEGYLPLEQVSLVALIANPRQYHGRRISVIGFFELYYDRMALFLTKEHWQAGEFSSMTYGDLPRCATLELLDEAADWRGNLVRIDGVFNADLRQFNAGTLQHVERVQLWSAESAPLPESRSSEEGQEY